jgi:Arc/MetJ family transcription regulator
MRTTIDIDKKLLSEAMRLTNAKTQTKTVSLALHELVRAKRLERLAARIGTSGLNLTKDDLNQMRRNE